MMIEIGPNLLLAVQVVAICAGIAIFFWAVTR